MDFSETERLCSRFEWFDQIGSTNVELAHRISQQESSAWPDFSVMATSHQTSGKGRLNREWISQPGSSLAVSVLLRPITPAGRPLPGESFSWLSLLSGLAMSRACNAVLPTAQQASIKWPNDVLIGSQKVSGILSEFVTTPQGPAVIVGAGVNLSQTSSELPVATATSLVMAGAQPEDVTPPVFLARYVEEFHRIVGVYVSSSENIRSSGLYDSVSEACGTIGQRVRVDLTSSETAHGVATGIDDTGALVVKLGECAEPLVVSAGDVTHLRAEDRE